MSTIISSIAAQTALSQIGDLVAAWQAGFKNIELDEVVLEDALIDAALIAGGPAAVLAPVLVPIMVPAIVAAFEQNQSMQPGSLPHIASGGRGSDPWMEGQ